jgi:acyl carrier protein
MIVIFDKLKDMIKDELGFETKDLTLASTLEDMGADSLDAVELIMAIEEAYDIEIAEADAMKFTSLGNIVSYIESKV